MKENRKHYVTKDDDGNSSEFYYYKESVYNDTNRLMV